MANAVSGNVIAFPKSKKRGPKVCTGPSAEVITLPTRDHVLTALSETNSPVEKMVVLMAYADRKYGTNRPSASDLSALVNELLPEAAV